MIHRVQRRRVWRESARARRRPDTARGAAAHHPAQARRGAARADGLVAARTRCDRRAHCQQCWRRGGNRPRALRNDDLVSVAVVGGRGEVVRVARIGRGDTDIGEGHTAIRAHLPLVGQSLRRGHHHREDGWCLGANCHVGRLLGNLQQVDYPQVLWCVGVAVVQTAVAVTDHTRRGHGLVRARARIVVGLSPDRRRVARLDIARRDRGRRHSAGSPVIGLGVGHGRHRQVGRADHPCGSRRVGVTVVVAAIAVRHL